MGFGFRRVCLALAVLAAVCTAAVPLAAAAKDDVTLISQTSAGAGGDAESSSPAISGDGRLVAFSSLATNLSAEDQPVADVFVRNTQTGAVDLVSRASSLDGGAPSEGDSTNPDISADGSTVAFESDGKHIAGTDVNNARDIYIRGLQTGFTFNASRATGNPGSQANASSANPSVSGDGNVIAFDSRATNLSTQDNNNVSNVFVRDLQGQATILVSRTGGAAGTGADGDSSHPEVSNGGRFVVFQSTAKNLSDADDDNASDIFVRDLEDDTTTLVSRASDAAGGAGGNADSTNPTISGDGSLVAFQSAAKNLVADDDSAATTGIYVRDLGSGTTTLVSKQSQQRGSASASGSSTDPAISDDGRFIAFRSGSDNLFPGTADDGADQIYVRDLLGDITELVSRASASGPPGDGASGTPNLSGDGHFVTFASAADNLSEVDASGIGDVFDFDAGAPTDPDLSGPTLDLKAKGRQRLGKSIKLTVSADEPAQVTLTGTAKLKGGKRGKGRLIARKGKPLSLGSTSGSVPAGGALVLKLQPPKRVAKKLKHAGKAKASLQVVGTDEIGNVTTKKLKLKLG